MKVSLVRDILRKPLPSFRTGRNHYAKHLSTASLRRRQLAPSDTDTQSGHIRKFVAGDKPHQSPHFKQHRDTPQETPWRFPLKRRPVSYRKWLERPVSDDVVDLEKVVPRRVRQKVRAIKDIMLPVVDITIDDIVYPFSPLLLRDSCFCPACVHPSTKQKLFSTVHIPGDIQAADVKPLEKGVSISWTADIPGYPADHRTELSHTLLSQIARSTSNVVEEYQTGKSIWHTPAQTQDLPDMEYDTYMSSEASLYKALLQLHQYGLLFVTNVPEDEESVSRVAERIGPLKNTFYGRTWDVRSVPEANNVAYTPQDIAFHMDLLYMQQPPHLQLLHCIRSSSRGGASMFTDSYAAVARLFNYDPEMLRTLSRVLVPYHYENNGHHYFQKRQVVNLSVTENAKLKKYLWSEQHKQRLDAAKALNATADFRIQDWIKGVAWSPPFQAQFTTMPLGDLERLGVEITYWHSAAQKFNQLIQHPDATYERMMKPGECVIFDNRRILHARTAFEVGDAGKERWLRGAYIDKDPYLSKIRVLEETFGALQ